MIKPNPYASHLFTTNSPRLFHKVLHLRRSKITQSHLPVPRLDPDLLLLSRGREAALWQVLNIPSSVQGEHSSTFPWSIKKNNFQVRLQLVCRQKFWVRINKISCPMGEAKSEKRIMEDVPAECTAPQLCFGSVSSSWYTWTQQEEGVWWAEHRNQAGWAWCCLRGVRQEGEISGSGELCAHKNRNYRTGQLWRCGHGWKWVGKVDLWFKASSGAEVVFEGTSVEALGAVDGWGCDQHKNVPYKSSWGHSPLSLTNCSTPGLRWKAGGNNPNFPLPRADFKIVLQTAVRTLKFSFPWNRCNEMVFV